jgi:hypothetical protein
MKQIRTLLHQQSNAKHEIEVPQLREPQLRVPFKVLTLIDHGTVSPPVPQLLPLSGCIIGSQNVHRDSL